MKIHYIHTNKVSGAPEFTDIQLVVELNGELKTITINRIDDNAIDKFVEDMCLEDETIAEVMFRYDRTTSSCRVYRLLN